MAQDPNDPYQDPNDPNNPKNQAGMGGGQVDYTGTDPQYRRGGEMPASPTTFTSSEGPGGFTGQGEGGFNLSSTGQGMNEGAAPAPAAPQGAPQAGQFANSNQGFLDWATQKYGADPTRGSGFVDANANGGLQSMLSAYGSATGNTANFMGGPSGDRVDFGQGAQDALTSGGQIWNASAGGGAPTRTGGEFGGGHLSAPTSSGVVGDWGPGGTTPGQQAPGALPYQPVNTISGSFNPQQPGANIQPQQGGSQVTGPGAFNPQQAGQLDPKTGQPQSALDLQTRQSLLGLLNSSQQPVDPNDPAISAQQNAYSATRNQAATRQRSAMAERMAASGLNSGGQGSGSFDSGLNGIYESAGQDIAGNQANLMGQEVAARRQQLMQSLQMAQSVGAQDEANQIQVALANMGNQYNYASMNQSGQLATQGMNQNAQLANQGNQLAYAGLNQQGQIANQQNAYNYAGLNQQGQVQHQGQLLQQAQGNQGAQQAHNNYLQQGSQFQQNLGLQQQQVNNQNSQFGQNLGLQYDQLGQNQSQFNDNYGLNLNTLTHNIDRDAMLQALMGGGGGG